MMVSHDGVALMALVQLSPCRFASAAGLTIAGWVTAVG
jgi:hypothetical protein